MSGIRCVALLGHPVGHSVSPAMQEAAFREVGLDWRFLPFDVVPERLEDAIRGLEALGFVGANVTVPHKLAALSLADRVDSRAGTVGACNTLVFRDGRREGYNTDVAGFAEAAAEAFGDDVLRGARVVVIGAGGAARAILAACIEMNARGVTVLNRSVERAQSLVRAFPDSATTLEAGGLDTFGEVLEGATVVVQTTSVGMAPGIDAIPLAWPRRLDGVAVYDVIYNPRETRFMREAQALGARVCDGLGMLVAQGAHAFALWTGREAPRGIMREAAERALQKWTDG